MQPIHALLLCCVFALTGCNTWNAAKQDAHEVGQSAKGGIERAGQATGRSIERAGQATGRGIERAGEKIQDLSK